jgi:hypothetical protein
VARCFSGLRRSPLAHGALNYQPFAIAHRFSRVSTLFDGHACNIRWGTSGPTPLFADSLVPLEALMVATTPFAGEACDPMFIATANGVVLCAKVKTSVVSCFRRNFLTNIPQLLRLFCCAPQNLHALVDPVLYGVTRGSPEEAQIVKELHKEVFFLSKLRHTHIVFSWRGYGSRNAYSLLLVD